MRRPGAKVPETARSTGVYKGRLQRVVYEPAFVIEIVAGLEGPPVGGGLSAK